jgi:hypothetical protein
MCRMKNGGAVQILRALVQILHNPKIFRLRDNLVATHLTRGQRK